MDYRTLKELVKRGEGKYLEFKLKTNHPEKIVREIVAFANTGGGQLLIGIGDDLSIKGLKYADEDEYILVKAINKYCSPAIEYTIDRVAIEGEREVLVFSIAASTIKPHYVVQEIQQATLPTSQDKKSSNQADNSSKKAYIRVADKSVQASKEVREILRRQNKPQNIKFGYGDKERTLMQLLDQHKSITVDSFATMAMIPRKLASKTLVLLVLANVLMLHPDELSDRYTMIPVET
jgi:predicted HTH transcriptional regulator